MLLVLQTVTSCDPDSQFTTLALSRLKGVGIPVMTSLNANIQLLQQVLVTFVPDTYIYTDTKSLLQVWLSYGVSCRLPPTWKNLFLIIRLLNLNDLVQRMESYLSGATDREEQLRRIKAEGECIQLLVNQV